MQALVLPRLGGSIEVDNPRLPGHTGNLVFVKRKPIRFLKKGCDYVPSVVEPYAIGVKAIVENALITVPNLVGDRMCGSDQESASSELPPTLEVNDKHARIEIPVRRIVAQGLDTHRSWDRRGGKDLVTHWQRQEFVNWT